MFHGLSLRARRLLKNHPQSLQKELHYLNETFGNVRNGYPQYLLQRWAGTLAREVKEKPDLLTFRKKERIGAGINEVQEESPQQDIPKRALIIPYISGISDQLRTVAKRYQIPVWYTYTGKIGDGFSASYKEKVPEAKQRHAIYEAVCTCNQRYIGESFRNLKVRINEHQSVHSSSALSKHLQLGGWHKLLPNLTRTVIREKQKYRRKILESLVILNYPDILCNMGPSTNISDMWFGCRDRLRQALTE